MRRIVFMFVWMAISFSLFSQGGAMEGMITDSETHAPLAYATVFFANTMIGTTTTDDGVYKIENIPPGKYDLIATIVGYQKVTATVQISGKTILNMELKPLITQLKPVVIDDRDWKEKYDLFLKYFLGQTLNSKKCVIKNPDDIYISYDDEEDVLSVTAERPIIIENPELGYRIHYLLETFEYSEKREIVKVFGIPRFEMLTPDSERQLRKWEHARDEAYFGSLRHFMRSLVKKELKKNDFTLFKEFGRVPMAEDSVLQQGNKIKAHGTFKVVYNGEPEDYRYRKNSFRGPQVSLITLMADSLRIYENGYYEDPRTVLLNGYLGWSETIGEMVPFEYKPKKEK